ncbi:MAG: MarR family transcriptional regulator [bacterium]|nr:MarR family transcriptional regulator [bacterium]
MLTNDIAELSRELQHLYFLNIHKKLKKLGLYPGQQIIINLVADNPGISQSKLVSLTNRKASTITKTLFRLENNGYIERHLKDNNIKNNYVYLTTKGMKAYNEFKSIINNYNELIMKVLTNEEQEQLLSIIIKLKGEMINERDI